MSNSFKHPITKDILLSFFSALLITLAFPKFNLWILIWIALVPLLLALEGKKPSRAFFIGYITGFFIFSFTLYWIVHVTLLGTVLLVLYLSLYYGLFALGVSLSAQQKFISKLFFLPSLWVALEYLRSWLLTGFGWVSLAHSQYLNLAFIQIADITGAAGISFCIVMVNYLVKEILVHKLDFQELKKGIAIVVSLLTMVLIYGFVHLSRDIRFQKSVNVAVIQANIPLEMKWDEKAWPFIMQEYMDLTHQAASNNPDLIIWPESAFPGFLWESQDMYKELKLDVERTGIPLVFGIVTKRNDAYYNSAVLLNEEGQELKQYDKLHLVLFGEYIPFRHIFPFLSQIVPIDDFTAGDEYTVFRFLFPGIIKSLGNEFSVMICFEDTVSEIVRRFVQRGANFLVNITNDAWFRDTKEPFLHLQSSVFRAVENRRSVVRAANTGVSCFIDPKGRITKCVENEGKKKTYVKGYAIHQIFLNEKKSFYTNLGDIFTYFCFGCILWMFKNIFLKNKE